MNDQEKIMSALAQGYQLLSKAMKQKPSKEGFQQVLQMLGDDGIQACVQVVDQGPEIIAQTMAEVIQKKQTQKAEKGAKLNRLIALNDSCPEGYLKKGGKCKKCEKGKKINPMEKGVFHVTAYFKDGGINKMQGGGANWAAAVGEGLKGIGEGVAAAASTKAEYEARRKKAEEETKRLTANQNFLGGINYQQNQERLNTLANNSINQANNGMGGFNNPNNFQNNLNNTNNFAYNNTNQQQPQQFNTFAPKKQKTSGTTITGTKPTWME